MTQTEQSLLALLRRSLFSAACELPRDTDFSELFAEASAQSVLPLVWTALSREEKGRISSDLLEDWEMKFFLPLSFNEVILYEQDLIRQRFSEQGISYVILKGSSVSVNYPDPSLRILGDIDLYVAATDCRKTAEILTDLGYRISMVGELHVIFQKKNVIVELHREPVDLSHCDSDAIRAQVRSFFSDILEKHQIEAGLSVPSDAHTAMLLILHKLGHFLSGELGLRQLCDFAVFLQQRMTAELWEILEPMLRAFGLLSFTKVMARVCMDDLGLPPEAAPWVDRESRALSKGVMEQILENGNFGRKTGNQYGQRLFVDPGSSNRIASFFKVLRSACRSHFPVCERHPILLPVAPFAVFGRYVRMRVRGERRRLRLISLYRRAGSRQKLFRDLRPFMGESKEHQNTEIETI